MLCGSPRALSKSYTKAFVGSFTPSIILIALTQNRASDSQPHNDGWKRSTPGTGSWCSITCFPRPWIFFESTYHDKTDEGAFCSPLGHSLLLWLLRAQPESSMRWLKSRC